MNNKFLNILQIKKNIILLKNKNKKIGFTNGCFDLLHKGHLELIEQSRLMCDYLIIGLNSDISIKELKGPERPIQNQDIRINNLSLLHEVDAIILFNEITPINIIKELIPDILFKGSDYEDKEVIGGDLVEVNGGSIKFIKILNGYSTTKIIKENKIL